MNKVARISRDHTDAVSQFVTGQVWRVGEKLIRIGHVGKRLVHYRYIKPDGKKLSAESFTKPSELLQLLKKHKALVLE